MKRIPIGKLLLSALFIIILAAPSVADNNVIPIPSIKLDIGQAQGPDDVVSTLKLVLLLTVLSLAPSILILTTAFTRIIIVLSLLRNAIGTQQVPPNQVLIGIALFLTFFVMAPVLNSINTNAIQPYINEQITFNEATQRALTPLREYLRKQTRESDLKLFLEMYGEAAVENVAEVPDYVLMPAYLISELKTAFQMGFILYIPFIVIDMVVASILMSMGMLMLPPVMISLPFKILLFVMVDGWGIVTRSLVLSFR